MDEHTHGQTDPRNYNNTCQHRRQTLNNTSTQEGYIVRPSKEAFYHLWWYWLTVTASVYFCPSTGTLWHVLRVTGKLSNIESHYDNHLPGRVVHNGKDWCRVDHRDVGTETKQQVHIKTLRPRKNGCHFADSIFQFIFFNENVCT